MNDIKNKYEEIFKNLSDIVYILDLKGNFIDINNAGCAILGYSQKEIFALDPHNISDSNKVFQKRIAQTIENGIATYESEFKKKDGTIIPVEITTKLFDKTYVLGIARDITERDAVEEAFKMKSEEQDLLLDNIETQVWYLVEPESYSAVNKARAYFLGFEKKELIGKNLREFSSMENADVCFAGNKKVFEQKIQIRSEEWQKNRNGELRLLQIIKTPKIDKNNNVEYVICTAEDITESKKAETEMKKRVKKTEGLNHIIIAGNEAKDLPDLLEKLLDTILNLMDFEGGGIYLVDGDTGFAEIVHHKGLPLDFIEDVKRVKIDIHHYKTIFIDGEPIFANEYNKINAERSKKWKIFSLASMPISVKSDIIGALNIASKSRYFFSEDEKELFTFICREMGNTISKFLAEQALRVSEEKYRTAFNRVEFYKDLFAHDINNILQNLKMSIDLGLIKLKNITGTEEIEKLNQMGKEQIHRGSKLVSNIQKLSQLEDTEIILKKIDIIQVLETSITFIKKSFQYKETHIILNNEFQEIYINGHEFLQDVFENILINSVKYTKESQIFIQIDISKERKNEINYIRIAFSDNGIGVPDSLKERIFERGLTHEKSGKGMGLGLSLVKKIILSYNGLIWVEDKVNGDYYKGSKFIIMIPEIN